MQKVPNEALQLCLGGFNCFLIFISSAGKLKQADICNLNFCTIHNVIFQVLQETKYEEFNP